ncbi:MAG: 2OG-Fe(II) oxygenase [Xanthomonadales bacterium]|nr:2OG-Fe(II) oxygenase [Xanthomonadales bacterium]
MAADSAPRILPTSTSSRDALSRCVQVFDDALPAAFCSQMVESFAMLSRFQVENGRNRQSWLGESAWTELDVGPLSDAAFRSLLLDNIARHLQRYNAMLGFTLPVPFTTRTSELIIKRYRPGGEERFQPHFDSLGAVSNRYLVCLWYLNDVAEGGETAFVDLDLEVKPRAGRLLMFPPYWMYQHEGRPPLSGDKYILSTYLLF